MKAKILFTCFVLFIGACCQQNKVFVQVVSDHKVITVETVDLLLAAIEADLAERQSMMSYVDVVAAQNLVDRLQYMKESSIAIEKWVFNQSDKKTLARLINDKVIRLR